MFHSKDGRYMCFQLAAADNEFTKLLSQVSFEQCEYVLKCIYSSYRPKVL